MSLTGEAALKVEEVVESADSIWEVNKKVDTLDHASLPIDHH